MFLLTALGFIPGSYLVYRGGIPAVIIGLSSVIALFGYSGGPFPYGSYALGDLMVFLFFGIAATAGTIYVQYCFVMELIFPYSLPENFPLIQALVISVPPGCLSSAILVINNLRDRKDDRSSGKRTLAVLLGRRGSLFEFGLLLLVSYLIPPLVVHEFEFPVAVGLPLTTLPLGLFIFIELTRASTDEAFNSLLEQTGRLLVFYSILLALGLIYPL
jgi:1,4-dihydroxy-2-naphthoate octaprenyltransferase